MDELSIFNDRRPKPRTVVPLTKKQLEIAEQYGLGEIDRGHLALTPAEHRQVLEAASGMMYRTQEWGKERKGDLASAKNLHTKLVNAVNTARKDPCVRCYGDGCDYCFGTGKQL